MSKTIKDLGKITQKDVSSAGGKGASLGELIKLGVNVPPGFVVLTPAFDQFLEETDLNIAVEVELKKVRIDNLETVNQASETIRDLISDEQLPEKLKERLHNAFVQHDFKRIAVRSSATAEDGDIASWAGELDSFLNVREGEFYKAVKDCWSSLFSPRAIVYRHKKNLQDSRIKVAVVAQKMIDAQVAGVCFTAHPITNSRDHLVVEAALGLGEGVVSGKVTPDTYVINKKNLEIEDKNLGEQKRQVIATGGGTEFTSVSASQRSSQKLPDQQIKELAEIALGIEKHYQKPQDIEWALDSEMFHITQSRPITTLKSS